MVDYFQEISNMAVALCDAPYQKLMIYSEVEDGVISADLFFLLNAEKIVRFRFAPKPLKDLIYSFWETGQEKISSKAWAVMQLVVEQGTLKADLAYPKQLNPDEDISERRPRAFASCFPGLKVDYSKPNG